MCRGLRIGGRLLAARQLRIATTGTLLLTLLMAALPAGRGATALAASGSTGNCSWGAGSNPDTVNVAYPDLDASYWAHQFVPASGERLVIKGEYPAARYFSFHVYDSTQVALDSVYDAQIAPDPGSSNPFRAKPRPGLGDSYTEYVDFTAAPGDPAPNTLYVGDTPQGTPTPTASLMYRVYVPTDPSSQAGGVPMPQITLETTSGTVLESYGPCASSSVDTGGELNQELADSNWPAGAPAPPIEGATDPPAFSRAFGNTTVGLDGNDQNAYLTATISRQYGDLVVIHAKAPTFPDTRAGVPAYAPRQLRYWSICENSDTTRVISCAADYAAAIKDGYFTYVISDPDDRPANATAANGVTWLPWGGAFASGVLIYRNMLPSPGFTEAIQAITQTDSPQAVMGPYYPTIAYCTPAKFQAGGWQACLGGS